jgi:hypothetical protein
MGNEHEILLGLTTTRRSDYERKINEIKTFGIRKIALFPTALEKEDRHHLYMLLENSGVVEIPHVHLRGQDMDAWELEMLEKKYKTRLFNVHQEDIDAPVLKPYLHKTYVENQFKYLQEDNIRKCAGICFDISHAEEGRIWSNSTLDPMLGLLDKYPIGYCHVSAVRFGKDMVENDLTEVARHTLDDLSEMDYVAKYKEYLPKYISIELENSFEQQMEVKKYLEKILST